MLMSRDIFLPEGGELEVLFSVYLMDWDLSNKESSKPELGPSINPKLQVFYDEDLVFDISKAISEHQNHYKFNRWNQFKMLSEYREGINITITLVGSRGLLLDSLTNTSSSLPVLIDNFNITTRRPAQSDKSFENKSGRLEPEAEVKEAGKWKPLQTEAEEEAENEEKELGRPAFCSLLPESTPCGRFPKKRYYFDAALEKCQEFMYEGCKGNENRFDDLETCKLICATREHIEPLQISLRKTEFTSFESGFQGWNTRNWEKVSYEEKKNGFIVPTPPILHPDRSTNEIGISPVHRTFDFRLPEMTQEFLAEENAMLLIAFQLLVKGVSSSGLLSFFLRLDPGLEIYVGNVKVFDFVTQGVADEHWHEYQILMNKTEVYEHRVKSGDQNLLITIRGWLGSNGEGLLVVDNINITQIPDPNSSNSNVNTKSFSTPQSSPLTTTTLTTTTTTTTETTTKHTMNDCSAQKEEGDCKGMFSRYYYNSRVRTCIQFFWSGCGGNSNRFLTEEECKSSCLSSRIDSSTPNQEFTVNNAEEVCAQPLEPGSSSCSQKLERFYFDVEVGSCVSFLFSGCEGNENNFLALSDCSQFCSNVTIKQIVEDEEHDKINIADCGLEYDPGTCTNYQPKYFYEPSSRSCQTFSYGGCGGNPNRFNTESECLSVCLQVSTTADSPAFSPEIIPERRPTEPLGIRIL
ncbi:uncharacterized protein LOC111716477 isoform X2 [Eurytemora carolleeae]|uniref:uncharacterized protein LOC111716477 isoform X2 n=1 Tax=Eurytemora carolleeae TaxID=1294199 RepID=UPI000C785447|nr:uncharacterized protein LOC111716477 isoform X2 [Eurytemora carolleeae]|eukprot:XP_023347715.1 uncharacterized protein LOC111716477 isoform X2 [Eurytemora affinis]